MPHFFLGELGFSGSLFVFYVSYFWYTYLEDYISQVEGGSHLF
jgi:hypothetical protein